MSDDVHVGRDGWLFLKGGSNSPFSFLTGELAFGSELVEEWCDLVDARSTRSKCQYVHLFAPNKETVYLEEANLGQEHLQGSPLGAIRGRCTAAQSRLLEKHCIDPTTFLRASKDKYQFYWKTDSHWTPFGCFAAYQLLCSKLQVKPVSELLSRPYSEGPCLMDLGSKLDPPVQEQARFYDFVECAQRTYANELVLLKETRGLENAAGYHVGSSVAFRNPRAADARKVVLFGDSFSEYRPSLLTGMLAETFSEVHFVWSVFLDFDFIDSLRPDILITEICERFMPIVPNDRFELASFVEKKVLTLR